MTCSLAAWQAAIRLWERAAGGGGVSKLAWLPGVSPVAVGCPLQRWGVGTVGSGIVGQDPLDFWGVSYESHPLVVQTGDAAAFPSLPSCL